MKSIIKCVKLNSYDFVTKFLEINNILSCLCNNLFDILFITKIQYFVCGNYKMVKTLLTTQIAKTKCYMNKETLSLKHHLGTHRNVIMSTSIREAKAPFVHYHSRNNVCI
jgi:hypothetical protein